jgi:hypothetical protein
MLRVKDKLVIVIPIVIIIVLLGIVGFQFAKSQFGSNGFGAGVSSGPVQNSPTNDDGRKIQNPTVKIVNPSQDCVSNGGQTKGC